MTKLVGIDDVRARTFAFPARHFISVSDLNRLQVHDLLALSETFVALNRQQAKKLDLLKGLTLMNLFFENSTRTQSSFERATRLWATSPQMATVSPSMRPNACLMARASSRA